MLLFRIKLVEGMDHVGKSFLVFFGVVVERAVVGTWVERSSCSDILDVLLESSAGAEIRRDLLLLLHLLLDEGLESREISLFFFLILEVSCSCLLLLLVSDLPVVEHCRFSLKSLRLWFF